MVKLQDLPFGWFDLVVAVLLVVGLIRGRKRGMSEELLDVAKWVAIVLVGARLYEPLGDAFSSFTHFSLLWSYVICYGFIVTLVWVSFGALRRAVGEKLVGSDLFGSAEYYLGMVAGTIRYVCVLLACLAILHAPQVTEEERRAMANSQRESFGDISFPTFGSIQHGVFSGSFSGILIAKHLESQLIASTGPGADVLGNDRLAKRKERAIDEVINERRSP